MNIDCKKVKLFDHLKNDFENNFQMFFFVETLRKTKYQHVLVENFCHQLQRIAFNEERRLSA